MCSGKVLNCSAIEFWQAREAGYPLLSKIAIDLISAPASQAYAERLFSVCGDLTAGKWNKMAKKLESRLFLRMNLEYFDNVNPVNGRECVILTAVTVTVTDMILSI